MGLTDLGPGAVPPGVPAVIFANRPEVLNQPPLSEPTRAGCALAIGGYLDYCRLDGLSISRVGRGPTWTMSSGANWL